MNDSDLYNTVKIMLLSILLNYSNFDPCTFLVFGPISTIELLTGCVGEE